MTSEDRMHATDLDRYWDEYSLTQRRSATEHSDHETADLIDRLWALGAPPDPDVARERVWRRLQGHRAWEERDLDAVARVENASEAPFGRTSPFDSGASRPGHGSGKTGWRSVMGQVATAALLILALAGSFVAFGPGRPSQESPAPARIPAMNAPLATPETNGVTTMSLLDLIIPTIGDDTAWVLIDRYTFSPATTMQADLRSSQVPEVFYVADGALDVRVIHAPQPARVIRSGGADAEETLMRGESASVTAGDAVIVPEDGAVDLMNMTPEPAIAYLLFMGDDVMPPGNTGIGLEGLVGSARNVSAPLAMTLEQVTLAPEASLPGLSLPDVERVLVPVDPDRVMDARIGSNGSLHNAGDEPLDAFVLTVTSGVTLP